MHAHRNLLINYTRAFINYDEFQHKYMHALMCVYAYKHFTSIMSVHACMHTIDRSYVIDSLMRALKTPLDITRSLYHREDEQMSQTVSPRPFQRPQLSQAQYSIFSATVPLPPSGRVQLAWRQHDPTPHGIWQSDNLRASHIGQVQKGGWPM